MNFKIFLTGFMGSGKTFWGKLWAKENNLQFFDLDAEIETFAGETVANIFENKSEEYFRETERHLLETFALKSNFILACGGGTPCFFDNLKWMNEQGFTIYLKASPGEIMERIKNEIHTRPLFNNINQSELFSFIEQKLKEREPVYKQAKHILPVDTITVSSLDEIIRKELRVKH